MRLQGSTLFKLTTLVIFRKAPSTVTELPSKAATDVAHELYNSEQNPSRDRAGLALRFNIPTVMNGRVYVGAKREVDVYGLLPTARAGK